MSDDIVTRLREGKGDDIVLFGMMYEAADEIEDLRAELKECQRQYKLLKVDRDRWQKIAEELYTWLDLSYDDESVHEAGKKAIIMYNEAANGE